METHQQATKATPSRAILNDGVINLATASDWPTLRGSSIIYVVTGARLQSDAVGDEPSVILSSLNTLRCLKAIQRIGKMENNENVKYEEQIFMRELEYRIEDYYKRDDDDDHDGAKDFRDGFH
ncbi:hypothetical protein Tco_0167633 [Tanacetum coccineum]